MNTNALAAVAKSVRTLSIDAVQAANSGHPGLPLGCAEVGALLYGEAMKHYPGDPAWPDRDRFVLSAGHGSMFLYSLLHLAGYDVPLDEVKRFRQVGSRTPGHPEFGETPGVETTTGPLGQGVGNAVGMAIAERMLAARLNTKTHTVVDHYTYALAGDGCMMEGISGEASSLAGHLRLSKLIVFYDSNHITIDGSTAIAFTENVADRYRAYGWSVFEADPYDFGSLSKAIAGAKADTEHPSLIVMATIIGQGSPNMAGSHKVHGAPLGEQEIKATRRNLGVDENEEFYVAPEALAYFAEHRESLRASYDQWQETFRAWSAANPDRRGLWDRMMSTETDALADADWPVFEDGEAIATRKASSKVIPAVASVVPSLVGGSADLEGSNLTAMPAHGVFTPMTPEGRTIRFGVREHAMGAICNGLSLHGGFRPFCATFLVFSDYMRPSIRLAALMGQPVIYVFTHDSIFVGEDGPTHQPIEHIAALRAIPGLDVLRPADAIETAEAWKMAVERTDGPTAIILTRQNLTVFPRADGDWRTSVRRGGYVARSGGSSPKVTLVATGSEVNLAMAAAEEADPAGRTIRVVSVMSRDRLLAADRSVRDELFGGAPRRIVVEVGISQGWEGIATSDDDLFCLNRFGVSGPAKEIAAHLDFTQARLVERITKGA